VPKVVKVVEPDSAEAFGQMYPRPKTRKDAFISFKIGAKCNPSNYKKGLPKT